MKSPVVDMDDLPGKTHEGGTGGYMREYMTVKEMGDLLGIKKTDRYWLIKKDNNILIQLRSGKEIVKSMYKLKHMANE